MPSAKRSSASSESRVLRSGNLRIKKNGVLSWSWKVRSVTLTDKALVTPNFKIPLDRITKLERVDVKPFCLLLETVERRYLLSFESDSDLYDWQEDVYSRCPLIGAGNPFGFQHNAHMGFDNQTGSFKSTGVPTQWTQQLGIQTQNTTEKENQKPPTQLKTHHRRDSSQGGTTTLHDSTPSLPYKSTMKTIPIAEKVVEPTTLDGEYSVRVEGLVVGWRWKAKWLTLGPKTLKISKSKTAKSALTLNLRDITCVDRADLGPHCLMLEIKSSKQYHLSFKNDDELYSWQDTLYARSPLAGISNPSDFVHKVHIGYDPNSGQFTGVPAGWKAIIDGTDRGAAAPVTSR